MSDDNLKILLLEENENLGVMMSDFLIRKNFRVSFMSNAKAGYDAFIEYKHKMCIIDIALFGDDGFKVIDEIHQLSPETYVIALLPKLVKVERFNVENEIHLSKPFSIEDLVRIIKYKNRLKIKGITGARTNKEVYEPTEVKTYKIGKYIFEVHRKRLTLNDQSTYLTKKEAGLLAIIVENANSLVKRETILEKIWINDNDSHRKARSMDVYICKLRKLLVDDPNLYLVNHHGVGYQIIGNVSEVEKAV
jgi:two-component system, OmpR family, response regulator